MQTILPVGALAGSPPENAAARTLPVPDATAPVPARAPHLAVVPDAPVATADDLAATVEAGTASVRTALAAYLDEVTRQARGVHPAVAALWEALADQVGGKMLRPRLVLAAYAGLGGDVDDAVPVAVAQELLHTAMLVHDDLLDHDEVRRGRPNVAGTFRARLAAQGVTGTAADEQVHAAALLGGDLAMASAVDAVTSSAVAPHRQVGVLRLLVRSVHTAVAGELLDVTGAHRAPRDVDALLVADLKTAGYTCVVPLLCGARLADAGPDVEARLERYGHALGVAFQLVDDRLGVFGDPDVTGKSVLSDLRAGTRTHLVAEAYRRADGTRRAVLDARLGDPGLTEEGAREVRDVLVGTGALAAVDAEVARRLADARDAAAGLPDPLASYLVRLTHRLAGRSS